MDTKQITEELGELDPEILLADGFEAALIGYVTIYNKTLALYDEAKCLDILTQGGMSEDAAREYFDYNVVGAWMGEKTPAFATIRRTLGD